MLFRSPGSGPTMSTPATAITSGSCWMARAASPATTRLAEFPIRRRARNDEVGRIPARRRMLGLGFDLIRNSQAIDHFGEMDAACATRGRIGIGDGFCVKQSLLESIGCGDVRFGCAFFHDYSHA